MSDSTDDPWADLYTELEVENAAKAAAPLPAEAEADDGLEDEGDDGPEDEGDAGGEADAPAADGEQPKKRRRRRRRRKGKGPGGEPLPADGEGLAVTDGDDAPPEAEVADGGEEVGEPAEVGAESAEQSREMIRTWNVPSWAEIVAGLYRPDRG